MKSKEFSLNRDSISGGIRSYHSILSPQKRPYSAHHHTQCELSVFLAGEGLYTVGKTEPMNVFCTLAVVATTCFLVVRIILTASDSA